MAYPGLPGGVWRAPAQPGAQPLPVGSLVRRRRARPSPPSTGRLSRFQPGAAACGAADMDWRSLPEEEHAAAAGGVARVLPAWLLSVPIFEFLRAVAAVAVGALAYDAVVV